MGKRRAAKNSLSPSQSLAQAIAAKNAKEVRRWLSQGVDPDSRIDTPPLLAFAVEVGATDCARALLEAGADPLAESEKAVLSFATCRDQPEMFEMMLAAVASAPDRVRAAERIAAALGVALVHGRVDACERLAALREPALEKRTELPDAALMAAQIGSSAMMGKCDRGGLPRRLMACARLVAQTSELGEEEGLLEQLKAAAARGPELAEFRQWIKAQIAAREAAAVSEAVQAGGQLARGPGGKRL